MLLLAQTSFELDMILSTASCAITAYFWLVRARRDRPDFACFSCGTFEPPAGEFTAGKACVGCACSNRNRVVC